MAQYGLPKLLEEQPEVFRRRACRGVPVEHRWQAWKASLKVEEKLEPGVYQTHHEKENEWTRLIEIDIPRTFPEIPLFDTEQQFSLLRVLNAFANFDPSVGYCQGMNFLAGLLLLVAQNGDFRESPKLEKEEEAFWMLTCLMSECRLSGFYRRHFPLLRRYLKAFDKLVAVHLPDLQEHFKDENVGHAVYLHQWFLTLFINCLPMPMVLVFWDAMICGGRGPEVILPITVSLLQVLKDVLLTMPFEEIVRFFKTMRVEEQGTDAAMIGRLVVAKSRDIPLPKHITDELREADPEDEALGSPPASPGPGGEKEFIFSPVQRGGTGDGQVLPDEGPSFFGSYLRQLSGMRRDLPQLSQGVRNWWEEARDNLQRVGAGIGAGLPQPQESRNL